MNNDKGKDQNVKSLQFGIQKKKFIMKLRGGKMINL